jgi:hypothetical protein
VKQGKKTVYNKLLSIGSISIQRKTRATIKLSQPYKGAVEIIVHPGVTASNGIATTKNYSRVVE